MKYFLFSALLFSSVLGFSQDNLVANGGFETISKKVKEAGSIKLCYPWEAPATPADVFNVKAKSEEYGVPKNIYGDADAFEGSGYAGITTYSSKDEAPRQFLQIKLSDKLEEEKVYCVKFHLMLGMMSKYASNNIGVYISEDAPTQKDLDSFYIQPQVIHSQNKVFDDMFAWTPVCQTYIAKGGEEYLTLGNFGQSSSTQNDKVKKPKGVMGTQARGAYYYIDEVSVMNMAGVESCDCELDASGSAMQVVYSVETSTEMEVDVVGEIEMTRIYFDELSSGIGELAEADIDDVAQLLKDNPQYKVKLVGHTDPVEEAKATGDVALNRANEVKTMLIAKGISELRLLAVGMQDFEPVTKDVTPAGQAQNRRVVFTVTNK